MLILPVGRRRPHHLARRRGSARAGCSACTPLQAIGGSRGAEPRGASARRRAATRSRSCCSSLGFGLLAARRPGRASSNPFGVLIGLRRRRRCRSPASCSAPHVDHAAGAAARRPAARTLAPPPASPPRTRCGTRERSSRTTIGLVIGVTLVTMFAVAMATLAAMILAAQAAQPEVYAGIDEMLDRRRSAIFSVLDRLQRAHRRGRHGEQPVAERAAAHPRARAAACARLHRAQLRRMILAESAQLTLAGGRSSGSCSDRLRLGGRAVAARRRAGRARRSCCPACPWAHVRRAGRRRGRAHPGRVHRPGAPRDARLAGGGARGRVGAASRTDERMPRRSGIRSSVMLPGTGPGASLGRASRPAPS